MSLLTPRRVRSLWLPAAFLSFAGTTVAAAVMFFGGRGFDAKELILSDLQSPDDNPRGYAIAAVGVGVTAILLTPVVLVFHRALRPLRPRSARAGTVAFALGLLAAFGIGVMAPFTHDYTPLHVALASTAFLGISAGAWLHLLAANAGRRLLVFQFAAVLAVAFLSCGPVQFDNHRLLTSLAFWEWVLCGDCAAVLWVLARAVERR